MRFLKCDKNANSYVYSIMRIIVCVITIVITTIVRIPSNSHLFEIVFRIVDAIITIIAIFALYLSAAEISFVRERINTKGKHCNDSFVKEYKFDDVILLIEKNDIIDIRIVNHGDIIKVGSYSDSKPGSSVFFDKGYYIDNTDYISIDDFKKKLRQYCENEKLFIVDIDGMSPI